MIRVPVIMVPDSSAPGIVGRRRGGARRRRTEGRRERRAPGRRAEEENRVAYALRQFWVPVGRIEPHVVFRLRW